MNLKYLVEQALEPAGTYAAAVMSEETGLNIQDYAIKNKIPLFEGFDQLHCTIVYSKKWVGDVIEVIGRYPTPIVVPPERCTIARLGRGMEYLVIKMESPELTARFNHFRDTYGTTTDFPNYVPHVSLTANNSGVDLRRLPPIDFPIVLVGEYTQDIRQK